LNRNQKLETTKESNLPDKSPTPDEKLQHEFFGVVNGTSPDEFGWLTAVHAGQTAGVR
jgi:hypothetical protein